MTAKTESREVFGGRGKMGTFVYTGLWQIFGRPHHLPKENRYLKHTLF